MRSAQELCQTLLGLERLSYPAYKRIKGRYAFPDFTLIIDHVQGDPYAAPSRMRARVPLAASGFPDLCWDHPSRKTGVCSHLARCLAREARQRSAGVGTGKGGQITVDAPGQEVLATTAVLLAGDSLEARFTVGLPAHGRRIMGRAAAEILGDRIPELVASSLFYAGTDPAQVLRAARCNQDADALRGLLADLGLVAFVAEGAVLPRLSGVDPRPMPAGTVPFRCPPSLRVEVDLPHAGRVAGMGIPCGVTLIVGGGFHGKSTLLDALALGVYNHRPGDGREQVVCEATAVKIRAEDRRSVAGVDISPFISTLPAGIDTTAFSTQDASGSTSQASSIQEAIEVGARTLLLDEDTSATNFMIRDHRMQELVSKGDEPITPFVDKVRQLWEEEGVSTILVMGGSGDYFEAADTVIAMVNYEPRDVTARARRIAARHRTKRAAEGGVRFGRIPCRAPRRDSLNPCRGKRAVDIRAQGTKTIRFGQEEIDLSALPQVVHPGQLRAIGAALLRLRTHADGCRSLAEILATIEEELGTGGLDGLSDRHPGDLAAFRRFELAAALNRLRTLRVAAGSNS